MIDPTFGIGGAVFQNFSGSNYDYAHDLVVAQPDNKLIVVGQSGSATVVARYNADGSLDGTFGIAGIVLTSFGGFGGPATSVAIAPDGKIAIGGYSYQGGSTGTDFAVARLNSDGTLDPTFDSDGKATIDFGSLEDIGYSVAVHADGKIVIGGYSHQGGSTGTDFAVARLNSDGTLDTTFDSDGKASIDLGSTTEFGQSVAVQADGQVVIGGRSYQDTGLGFEWQFAVARLNNDGTLNTGFDGDGRRTFEFGSYDDGTNVAVQANGKIVIGGYSNQGGSTGYDFAVSRLNSDGTFDTTFDSDGKATIDFGSTADFGQSVAVQADGQIVIGGYSYQGGSTGYDFAVSRLNSDGTLDTTFDIDGKATIDFGTLGETGSSVAVQADGQIVIGGYSYQGGTLGHDFAVARLNSDGALDTTFDGDGTVLTDIVGPLSDDAVDVAIQLDGKIVALVSSLGATSLQHVVRYHSNGTLDTSFGVNGVVAVSENGNEFYYGLIVGADGKIVIGGYSYRGGSSPYDFAVARLDSDGSLDTTFDGDGKAAIDFNSANDYGQSVAVQADGKIVIGGYSYRGGSSGNDFAVARLNSDGSLDTTFNTYGIATIDFGSTGDFGQSVAVQADGKIVIGGNSFQGGSAGNDFAVARFNSDGTVDTTFDGDGKATVDFGSTTEYVRSVAVLADGKIVIGGYWYQGGSTGSDFAVALFNSDGTLDAAFDGDGKVLTMGNGFAVQTDGKIVVAGEAWDSFAATGNVVLLRYNLDGTLDNSFGVDGTVLADFGSRDPGAEAVAIQSDGKIVVAGWILRDNGDYDALIARFLASGTPAPVAVDDSYDTTEDGSVAGNVLGNDANVVDGATLISGPTHGTLTFHADGSFTYTPGIGCEASEDQFTYEIGDGSGGTLTAVVTITILHYSGVVPADALGVLRVGGGDIADVVTVSGGNLIVNGIAHSLTGVTEVRVWGRDNNDTIDLSALAIKTFIDGGRGHDVLSGGSVDDVIFGGDGDDTITGGSGHDLLIGGTGKDRIVGSAGNDILVAGDLECGLSLEDLREISHAWATTRTTVTESNDDSLDEAVTDIESDMLTGSSGADLFIISLGDKTTDFQLAKPNTNKDGDVVVTIS